MQSAAYVKKLSSLLCLLVSIYTLPGYTQQDTPDEVGVSGITAQAPDFVDEQKMNQDKIGTIGGGIELARDTGLSLFANLDLDGWIEEDDHVALAGRVGKAERSFSALYRRPYSILNSDGILLDALFDSLRADPDNSAGYRFNTASLFFKLVYQYNSSVLQIGPGIERTNIERPNPIAISGITEDYLAFPLTASWVHDQRKGEGAFYRQGMLNQIDAEIAIGDVRYIKANHRYEHYFPLTQKVTSSITTELGAGDSYRKGGAYPITKNFFDGGIGSVRGYAAGGIGPQDQFGNRTGAKGHAILNAELFYHLANISERPLYLSTFYDAAYLTKTKGAITGENNLYQSAGLGLLWQAPIGLVRIYLAKPINQIQDGREQTVQFDVKAAVF